MVLENEMLKIEELLNERGLRCLKDHYRGRHIGTIVSGIQVEYNWGSGPVAVKLFPDNRNENIQQTLENWVIENWGEDSIVYKKKPKTSAVVNFLPGLNADQFINIIDILLDTDFELEFKKGSKDKRGQITFHTDSVFLRLAKTYRFAEEMCIPDIVSRGCGIMDRLDDVIVCGESVNRTDKNTYREHVVPCDYLGREAIEMIREGKSDTEVSIMLQQNLFIVLITREEAEILDTTLGLKTDMPEGWKLGDNPLARLNHAGIKLK